MREKRNRPLSSITGVLAVAVVSGCAATSSPTGETGGAAPSSGSVSVATTTATHHHPRTRPAQRLRGERAARKPGTHLALSTASSTTVQSQPPPGSCHARGSAPFVLPDPHCTPGAISPAVTQASIRSTICRRGYTKTVRPSESVTEPEKLASMRSYGDSGSAHGYEYDHLVSLELGGATNDARNLWPEPGASPNTKDRLENRLHALVCDGEMTLADAQRQIAGNWVAAYHRLFG